MKKKKFDVGVEIPQSMQAALLGGQGCEKISITISLAASANLSGGKDKDSDADDPTTPVPIPTLGGGQLLP